MNNSSLSKIIKSWRPLSSQESSSHGLSRRWVMQKPRGISQRSPLNLPKSTFNTCDYSYFQVRNLLSKLNRLRDKNFIHTYTLQNWFLGNFIKQQKTGRCKTTWILNTKNWTLLSISPANRPVTFSVTSCYSSSYSRIFRDRRTLG